MSSTLSTRLAARTRALAEWARSLPTTVVDAAIALGCYLTITINAVADDRSEWWIFALAAANALPLMWRRRYPVSVTAIAGVTTTWLAVAGGLGQVPAAQLVATYTFAALSPPVLRLVGVLGTVVGITVSILGQTDEVLAFGPAGITFAVAYALGTGTRARRDRIAMLEERARRHAEEQEAAAVRERERIARDMHDILAHSIGLVVVQAEAGPVVVRSDPDKAEEVFNTISATAREALAQLRRALGVLRAYERARQPQPDLDELPALVDTARRAGLTATLEQDGRPRTVPRDLAATTYRIVQESLTNTLRHAGAGTVRVRLEWRDRALRVEVSDDGRGSDEGAQKPGGQPGGQPGGHGLVGMRERVAALGGELTTGPGPDGTGFQVVASLPYESAA